MRRQLSISLLQQEAAAFARTESKHKEPSLFGITDGKAVGTYLEHKFQAFLQSRYLDERGCSAKGIDFPELGVDIKVTSIKQPQSSCPFKSARQKIDGLGYSPLVFVYDKRDDEASRTGQLEILHTIFVGRQRTADYQTTFGLRRLIENNANRDDLLAFFQERMLPIDEIEAQNLAELVLRRPPELGYLTVSSALPWRLQYSRVIEQAGKVTGILRLV
jgi:hypothetical protein